MAERLFGLEAELALSATRDAQALPTPVLVAAVDRIARQTLVHLPSPARRMFLANGSLLYVDVGNHPEVATPECSTPWEAVRHLRAGERLVHRLAESARQELDADSVLVSRSSVDYHAGTTWGCHESYLGRMAVGRYKDWLIPHLVSRIVFTGCGGIDPLSPGIRLSLSPRVSHIDRLASPDSTASRGIFHTRDEPLCRGYSRIHVLVGDNACSHRATWLKMATTALVVALAEAVPADELPIRIHDPVRAMKRFAREPGRRALVRLGSGAGVRMTATAIQRELLARVEALAGSERLPAWAPRACVEWRAALDLLDSGDLLASPAFDWPLKQALFQREIARRGYTQPMIDAWSEAIERIWRYVWPNGAVDAPVQLNPVQIDRLQQQSLLGEAELATATRILQAQGLSWQDLDGFNALRRQLCVIDVRFGAMGDGIFDSLDRQGLIAGHRMVSGSEIDAAAHEPPPASRAAERGRWIERLAGRRRPYQCDWNAITGRRLWFDLSDPFATEGTWTRSRPRGQPQRDGRTEHAAPPRPLEARVRDLLGLF